MCSSDLVKFKHLPVLKSLGSAVLAVHILWFCDEVIVFKGGRIVSKGSVAQVLNNEPLAQIYGDVCTFERLAQKEVILPKL